jgi:hypothetical protein
MVQPKTRFNGQRRRGIGKPKRIFYIAYWRGGRKIEEKAGREKADDMTAYNASILRSAKIDGKPSRHEEWEAAKAVEEGRWTFDRLWQAWKEANPTKSGRVNDDNRYRNHLKNLFGDKEPREIVPLDVDRLRVRMQKAAAPPPGRKRKKPTTPEEIRHRPPPWQGGRLLDLVAARRKREREHKDRERESPMQSGVQLSKPKGDAPCPSES